MSQRIKKINELIKHEVAEALRREAVGGFITVKAVETTRNMKQAEVWISILGESEGEVMERLEENRHYIQQVLSSKMTSKNVPRINFKIDHSGEHAQRIEELLKDDRQKDNS